MPRQQRTLTTRWKLILKYTAMAAAVILAVSSLYLFLKKKPRAYRPGESMEGITSELARNLPDGHPVIPFTNVTEQAGIDFVHFPGRRSTQLPEDMGSGVAWGDYDGDGDYDLYLCNIAGPMTASPAEIEASAGTNRLYRNNGDGLFTDVTVATGLEYRGIGMAAAWADFDNDGDQDLSVSTYGAILLYRNNADGTFDNIAQAAGLAGHERYWSGVTWADYDRDSYPDLYVCAYVKYQFRADDQSKASSQFEAAVPFTLNPSSYPPEANVLYRNNGDGTFTDRTAEAGVANETGRSLTAAWWDFDVDGRLDLYIANDVSDNAMYRNLGDGRFENVSHEALVSDYRGAMGLAVGDYDDDTDPDLFITHWMAQENALFWNTIRSFDLGDVPGSFQFMDIADMLGLGQHALDRVGWATSFFDFDNDGRLDLFVVNGSTFQEEADPSRLVPMSDFLLWQQSPEDGFFDVGPVSGTEFTEPHVGRGAAYADYDDDGDLDLVILQFGEAPSLLRNDGGNQKNWLKIRLRGNQSGRDANGAVVEIVVAGKTHTRYAGHQPSYLSQSAPEIHIGLGASAAVDAVRVRFTSGETREMTNVPVNQTLVVEE
jgi:enediyne biosynthesis protein E4